MRKLILAISLVFFAFSASAEIYNCNGVITNQPCPGGQKMMGETPVRTPDPKRLEQTQRDSLLLDLEGLRRKAEKHSGQKVDISHERATCTQLDVEACRQVVQEKNKQLQNILSTAVKQEDGTQATAKTEPVKNTTIINVLQDDDYINSRSRRPPGHPGTRGHPGNRDKEPPLLEDPLAPLPPSAEKKPSGKRH